MKCYGPQARRAMRALFLRHGRSYDAFAAHLGEHGIKVSKQLVGQWAKGDVHLPASILPHIEVFFGDRAGARGWLDDVTALLRDEDTGEDHASGMFRVRQLRKEALDVVGILLDVDSLDGMTPLAARRAMTEIAECSEALRLAAAKLAPIADQRAAK